MFIERPSIFGVIIIKQNREGLNKLKDIYSKNQKFGDSQSADAALRLNDEKLVKCMSELKKYQDLYSQVEQQYSCSSNNSEYSSSSTSSSAGRGGGGGSGSGESSGTAQYHSPAASATVSASAKSSPYPGTPISSNNNNHHHHLNNNNNHHHHHHLNGGDSNSAVAYAVSPVSHLNNTSVSNNPVNNNSTSTKMAPLVSLS